MKKFWFIIAAVVCTLFAAISCDNAMSRKYGGSTTINLPAGQKLIEVALCQKVLKVCKSV